MKTSQLSCALLAAGVFGLAFSTVVGAVSIGTSLTSQTSLIRDGRRTQCQQCGAGREYRSGRGSVKRQTDPHRRLRPHRERSAASLRLSTVYYRDKLRWERGDHEQHRAA